MRDAPPVLRLTPADLPLMRGMLRLFSDVFEEPHNYSDKQPDDAYLGRLLARDHFIALAARDDGGAVVGGLTAYILDKPEQARSEVYAYDLAVDPAHRRRGIATALIRTAGEAGAAAGAHVMFIQADHGDEAPIALYDKLGRREEVLHFDIPVGGPPAT